MHVRYVLLVTTVTVLAVTAGSAPAKVSAPRGVPAQIDVHAVDKSAHPVYDARVIAGVQVYQCTASGMPAAYAWKLVGPEAVLGRRNRPSIYHSFGPRWEYTADHSAIIGKVLAQAPSASSGAISQLLLKTTAVPGAPKGKLTHVAYVQRLRTAGGQPRGRCAADTVNQVTDTRYTARYVFYTP